MKPFLMVIITQIFRFTTVNLRDRISFLAGLIWYLIASGRRKVIRENIRTVKGSVSERKVLETFVNFMKVCSDILNIPNMSRDYVESMVESYNINYLERELKKGNGLIIAASHLGGMELAGPYLASLGYPLFSIAESEGPGIEFFRFYKRYREHLGNRVMRLEERNLIFKLIRLLRNNKVVVLIADRDIQSTGGDYEFFGRISSFPKGVALLSKRTGAPILIGMMVLYSGKRRYKGGFYKAIYPEDYDSPDEITEEMIRIFEMGIIKYTEQWFVFQGVWKD